MRIQSIARVLLGIVILCLSACSKGSMTDSTVGFHPRKMVVFGDSYSDNGNTYQISQDTYPKSPPYWKGRFSNGRVWTERLAQQLHINPDNASAFIDVAYGQAQAKGNIELRARVKQTPYTFTIPDLAGEYSAFSGKHPVMPKNTLYVVFIGANDFCNQFTPQIQASHLIGQVLGAQKELLSQLRQHYQASHFLIVNARDITAAPIAQHRPRVQKGFGKRDQQRPHGPRLLRQKSWLHALGFDR